MACRLAARSNPEEELTAIRSWPSMIVYVLSREGLFFGVAKAIAMWGWGTRHANSPPSFYLK